MKLRDLLNCVTHDHTLKRNWYLLLERANVWPLYLIKLNF